MKRISATEARDTLPELLKRAAYGHDRFIVENRGKELAAIISMDDLRLYERLLGAQEDRRDVEAARAALAEAESKGVKTLDKLTEELAL